MVCSSIDVIGSMYASIKIRKVVQDLCSIKMVLRVAWCIFKISNQKKIDCSSVCIEWWLRSLCLRLWGESKGTTLDPLKMIFHRFPATDDIFRCGRPYYCREGCRGPCRANEIFKFGASTRYSSPLTCPSVQSLWIHGCRPAHTGSAVRTNSGHCVPQRPCTGYPSSYRYYAQTRRCYPTRPRWWGFFLKS